MEPEFWQERWRKQEIAFHQDAHHDLLQVYWPHLGLKAGSDVFVPLCGKSNDMHWLAQQGHRVIGAELSEIAIDSFFAERGIAPVTKKAGRFIVKSADAFELWCGDIFDLPQEAVACAGGVYDRAALIAFPATMQERYADKLMELVPHAPGLLITLDYDQDQMSGPPFATQRQQVNRLFADHYDVKLIACRPVLDQHPRFIERGLTALEECAYMLRRP